MSSDVCTTGIFSERFADGVMKAACLYLILPVALFLGFWLTPLAAAAALALLMYLMLPLFNKSKVMDQPGVSAARQLIIILFAAACAIVFSLLSTPLLTSIPLGDAVKHGAILADLSRESWPTAYFMPVSGPTVLRYSFAYYLVPAALTKVFGPQWIDHAAAFWTAAGVFLFLLMTVSRCKSLIFAVFAILVAMLFSGLAMIYIMATNDANPALWSSPLDAWARGMGNQWLIGSHPFELRWSPQHALPSWLAAGLLFHCRDKLWFNRCVGLIGGCLALWSPFVAVSYVLVILAAAAFEVDGILSWRHLLNRRNILAAILSVPIALFLTADAATIPANLFLMPNPVFFIPQYIFFAGLEFVILLIAVRYASGKLNAVVGGSAIVLLALPFTLVGASSDLQMRGSQLPFTIVMFAALAALNIAKEIRAQMTMLALLVVGVIGGLAELERPGFHLDVTRDKYIQPIFSTDFGGNESVILSQYMAKLPAASPLTYLMNYHRAGYRTKPVYDMTALPLSPYGVAQFDAKRRRVESAIYTDAALVSPSIVLPPGLYRMELVMNWQVVSKNKIEHAAHLSYHGKKILMPIATSVGKNKKIEISMHGDGQPFKLSFGLGGWGAGKGFIEVKEWKIVKIEANDPNRARIIDAADTPRRAAH